MFHSVSRQKIDQINFPVSRKKKKKKKKRLIFRVIADDRSIDAFDRCRSATLGEKTRIGATCHVTSRHLTSPHLTSPHLMSRHVTSRHVTSNGSAGTNLASGVAPYDRDKSTTDPASRNSRTRESKSQAESGFSSSRSKESPLAARNWPDTKRTPRGKVGRRAGLLPTFSRIFLASLGRGNAVAESAPIIDRRYWSSDYYHRWKRKNFDARVEEDAYCWIKHSESVDSRLEKRSEIEGNSFECFVYNFIAFLFISQALQKLYILSQQKLYISTLTLIYRTCNRKYIIIYKLQNIILY